ncbi:MAG: ATP synthase F1 subunit gamma [Patescibacteria group bacterium]
MAGIKEIKRRIKSIKNTEKITKAMELVAASKMKRAIASTLASRPYAEYSRDVLASVAQNLEEISHPLMVKRNENKTGKTLLLLVTSDRGLCGAFNAQIIRRVLSLLRSENSEPDIATIGRKGDKAMRRLGRNVVATFELPDHVTLVDVIPVAQFLTDEFSRGDYKRVIVAYTDFVSTLSQKPRIRTLLPVSKADLEELIEGLAPTKTGAPTSAGKISYLVEGEKEKLIGLLAEKLTRMQLYQMLLESRASEQSARMVAMKNASDASGEMIEDLSLVFNKVRQSNITREISEISAGMASVS